MTAAQFELVVDVDGELIADVEEGYTVHGLLRKGTTVADAYREFIFSALHMAPRAASSQLGTTPKLRESIVHIIDIAKEMGAHVTVRTRNPTRDCAAVDAALARAGHPDVRCQRVYRNIDKVLEPVNGNKVSMLLEDDPAVALDVARAEVVTVLEVQSYGRIKSKIYSRLNRFITMVRTPQQAKEEVVEAIKAHYGYGKRSRSFA